MAVDDFHRIESLLLALAERIPLKGKTAAMFREYIDHGEYGLALDETGIGMFDAGRSPSAEELDRFRVLAALMKLDVEECLDEARERARYPE